MISQVLMFVLPSIAFIVLAYMIVAAAVLYSFGRDEAITISRILKCVLPSILFIVSVYMISILLVYYGIKDGLGPGGP